MGGQKTFLASTGTFLAACRK